MDQARAMNFAQKQSKSYTRHQTPTVNVIAETEVESTPPCICAIIPLRTTKVSVFFYAGPCHDCKQYPAKDATYYKYKRKGHFSMVCQSIQSPMSTTNTYDYDGYYCFSFFRTTDMSYDIYI